jgi:hypothetical protein
MKRANLPALTVLAAGLALLLDAAALQAGNLNFLKDSPLRHFSKDDSNLMLKNARAVLDSSAANASQTWRNPKTGASGLAEVKAQFNAPDGTPCKRLRVENSAKGIEGEATYTVCKYSDRGWALSGQATPAP